MRQVAVALLVIASCGRVNFERETADAFDGDRVVALEAGGGVTCALRASKTVWCWGSNSSGQLGDGTTTSRFLPAPVLGITDAVQLSVSNEGGDAQHVCVRDSAGRVSCWGSNFRSGLGDGTTTDASEPLPVIGLGPMRAVSVGGLHTCAVAEDGGIWCWGHNTEGQTSAPVSPWVTSPRRVMGLPGATHVAAAHRNTSAIVNDALWYWGGLSGPTPFHVVGSDGGLRAIDDGIGFICMLRTSGVVDCFGGNGSGQLGNGSLADQATPAPVMALPPVSDLTASMYNTCARTAAGAAYCWGRNTKGQLAGATTSNPATLPVELVAVGAVELLTMGTFHACALRDGEVICWGDNEFGQLGVDPTVMPMSATPVRVALP